jgi:hypothetical protein
MAVLFRSKYPSESVYIPEEHRFIAFVNGEYSTEDGKEIAVLKDQYEHDREEVNIPADVSIADVPKKRGRPKNVEITD